MTCIGRACAWLTLSVKPTALHHSHLRRHNQTCWKWNSAEPQKRTKSTTRLDVTWNKLAVATTSALTCYIHSTRCRKFSPKPHFSRSVNLIPTKQFGGSSSHRCYIWLTYVRNRACDSTIRQKAKNNLQPARDEKLLEQTEGPACSFSRTGQTDGRTERLQEPRPPRRLFWMTQRTSWPSWKVLVIWAGTRMWRSRLVCGVVELPDLRSVSRCLERSAGRLSAEIPSNYNQSNALETRREEKSLSGGGAEVLQRQGPTGDPELQNKLSVAWFG